MCLSTVFQYQGDPANAEEVCSNISSFEVTGDSITFVDLLGEEYVVEGSITSVDFVKSRIYIAS